MKLRNKITSPFITDYLLLLVKRAIPDQIKCNPQVTISRGSINYHHYRVQFFPDYRDTNTAHSKMWWSKQCKPGLH